MAVFETLQTLLTFLTLISVPVGVFYYVNTLRNARKAREARVFLQFSDKMCRSRWFRGLSLISETTWESYEELLNILSNDDEANINWTTVYVVLEQLGGLVRGGYIGIPILAFTTGSTIPLVWKKIEHIVDEWRNKVNNPRMWSEIEYLYNELMKYMDEHPELKT